MKVNVKMKSYEIPSPIKSAPLPESVLREIKRIEVRIEASLARGKEALKLGDLNKAESCATRARLLSRKIGELRTPPLL